MSTQEVITSLCLSEAREAKQSNTAASICRPRHLSTAGESPLTPLQQVLTKHDPEGLIIECPCLDRKHNQGRQQFERKMLELAQSHVSDNITLLILGSGNMGQSFRLCEMLMARGKNVNLLLIEPRFSSRLEEGHASRILTDDDFTLFDTIAKELSKKFDRQCRISGKFSTLSAYFIHLLAWQENIDLDEELAVDSFIGRFLSYYQNNEDYRDLSLRADYFSDDDHRHANAANCTKLLKHLGFSGAFSEHPQCPNIISAIDVGANCEQLTKDLRSLAYFITETMYPTTRQPDSVISWTTNRIKQEFWKTETAMDVIVQPERQSQLESGYAMEVGRV